MLDLVTPESVNMNSAQLARVGEHLARHYVDPVKIPGAATLVARGGKVCYLDVQGRGDVERDTPMREDTIVRIYSMTKPITSLALMMLHERGLFSLSDPVHRYIPQWAGLGVWSGGSFPLFATESIQSVLAEKTSIACVSTIVGVLKFVGWNLHMPDAHGPG